MTQTAKTNLIASLRLGPEASIMTAIETLSRGAHKIVLITDTEDHLLGIVTDYDIRMAILAHIPLDRPIGEVMNRNPVTFTPCHSDMAVLSRMESSACMQLPIVDAAGRVVDVRFLDEFLPVAKDRPDNVVVIMAGGLGTRLRPMTEQVPKPLLTVGGRPILFILLDQIISEGFDRIYISLNYKSEMIIKAVQEIPGYRERVEFVMEGDTPLGTAGSLTLLPERPTAPFIVINGDLLTNVALKELMAFHNSEANRLTMAVRREHYKIPYGVVDLEGSQVTGLREKPDFSYYFNTGIYAVDPSLLESVASGRAWNMTDLVDNLLARNERVGAFPVHEFWIDIGTPDQYQRAQTEFEANFK